MQQYTIDSGFFNLAAGVPKTALQLVLGATRRQSLCELKVDFASTNASDAPVLIELREQSSAGTSTAGALITLDRADPAAISTSRIAFTVEPTDVSAIAPGPWQHTPIGGLFVYSWSLGLSETKLLVSTRCGVRLTSPQALTNVRVYLTGQE